MDIIVLRDYCLQKKGVEEGFPFDNSTLVFKVKGKMFLLTNIDKFESMNVKCDPEWAIELRERYSEIIPGYHMNKTHWNTIYFNGEITNKQMFSFIDHSYELIVAKLSKKIQQELLDEN